MIMSRPSIALGVMFISLVAAGELSTPVEMILPKHQIVATSSFHKDANDYRNVTPNEERTAVTRARAIRARPCSPAAVVELRL